MKLILITIGVVFLVGCGKVKDEITSRLGGAGAEESSEKIPENSQVSDTSYSGEWLLGMASRNGNLARVKKLLAEGANVDSTEETGRTPIVEAAREGHMEVVATLLAYGADIDGGALYFSLKYGNPEVAELLILCGADVDKKYQSYDDAPLMHATRERLYDVGALMVVKGVNMNGHGAGNRTPLDVAEFSKGFAVFLREHGALTYDEIENGGTMDPEVTRNILDKHRSYNDIDPETGPNLDIHIAVHFGDEATLRKIIEIGANLNAVNDTGYTPLMWATIIDRFQLAKMLIDAGADINFSNNGRTALHYSVAYNKINIVKLFLENGVDVNVQDQYGGTPLDRAISPITRSDESRQIVNLLRSNGAKTGDVVDEEKRQAEAKKPKTFPAFLAALEGNMDEVRQRLDAGLAVNSRDGIGDTLLHNAAWKGHGELAEYLVSQKADVNALNKR
ncbi:MAG: hypothetical protein CMO63_06505, partial [Verrucomicrobiales bacterium]|nr:hypothetical protein [Verrucomicrobiales bacterium]